MAVKAPYRPVHVRKARIPVKPWTALNGLCGAYRHIKEGDKDYGH